MPIVSLSEILSLCTYQCESCGPHRLTQGILPKKGFVRIPTLPLSFTVRIPTLPLAFTVRIPTLPLAFTVRIPTLPLSFTVRIPYQTIYIYTFRNFRMMSEITAVVRVPCMVRQTLVICLPHPPPPQDSL